MVLPSLITSHTLKNSSDKRKYALLRIAESPDRPVKLLVQEPRLLNIVFEWMAERHLVFERRLLNEPFPWTTDLVLQQHSFCNVYRLLDAGTQWLIHEVVNEGGSQDLVEVVFRTILYRLFNKTQTWQLLVRSLGPELKWSEFNVDKYCKVLAEAEDEAQASGEKLTLYTSAHQVSAPPLGQDRYYKNHLLLLKAMMDSGLPKMLAKCEYLVDAFGLIRLFPGFGSFLAFQ
jgi:hypothetical protein